MRFMMLLLLTASLSWPAVIMTRAVIMASSLPLEERAIRAKKMLEARDYAGAALEAKTALEILPELADVARMRGRALLDPLIDQMMTPEGTTADRLPDRSEFTKAYEAFRLAAIMDPDNNEEARAELEWITELFKRLPNDSEVLETGVAETEAVVAGKPNGAKQGTLRFDVGARVECNRGAWYHGTVVAHYYREVEWPPGQLAPYQVQLDDGTLIYVPADEDGYIRVESGSSDAALADESDAKLDVIVVGAGAAGVGIAVMLIHTFGLDPSRVLLVERGEAIGTSFRLWPEEMRFISPSFNQQGWTSSFDLNSIAFGTSPAFVLHSQHPSGEQYADYLNAIVKDAKLPVQRRTEVRARQGPCTRTHTPHGTSMCALWFLTSCLHHRCTWAGGPYRAGGWRL